MRKFFGQYWLEITGGLASLFIVHTPLIFSNAYRGSTLNPDQAGVFGDFVGGYIGTLFLVVSVAILSASYRNQRTTNERTVFEARFFELLKYHRENVSEIGLSDKFGRRVFVSLIREFREAMKIVEDAYLAFGKTCPKSQVVDLSYSAFYFGVGPNSSRLLKGEVSRRYETEIVTALVLRMESVQARWYEIGRSERNSESESAFARRKADERGKLTRLTYCPFDGHQSRLGHYFRHLFQLIRYAAEHAPKGTAKEYADIARAQLTNHEQALLRLHVSSSLGKTWKDANYLKRFSLTQDLPIDFFDPNTEVHIDNEQDDLIK